MGVVRGDLRNATLGKRRRPLTLPRQTLSALPNRLAQQRRPLPLEPAGLEGFQRMAAGAWPSTRQCLTYDETRGGSQCATAQQTSGVDSTPWRASGYSGSFILRRSVLYRWSPRIFLRRNSFLIPVSAISRRSSERPNHANASSKLPQNA